MPQNAIFWTKIVSNLELYILYMDDLWAVVRELFKEPIIGPLKSKMAEIRHLGSWCQNVKRDFLKKNKQLTYIYWQPIRSRTWAFQKTHYWIPNIIDGWDPPSWKSTWRHFFCLGWSDLDKILQTGAEWHVDCGYIFEIETIYRIPIWRTFGRTQWHVIPEPPATLQGAATWWIHCHDSRAICHIAGAVTWRNQCHDRATLQGIRILSQPYWKSFFAIFYVFIFCFLVHCSYNGRRIRTRGLPAIE